MIDLPVSSAQQGWVFAIHRAAIHDGPGIRTAVFLQGCPLRCQWCHNPESMARPWLPGESKAARARLWSVDEVIDLALRDRPFYEETGGGVTFTGGEPTAQFGFCLELCRRAKEAGLHVCLDTSGLAAPAQWDRLMPHVDTFLFDLKATGEAEHRRLTGVDPRTILASLRHLVDSGADVILRCPLVPGVNDTDSHLRQIAGYSHLVRQVDLMPYHTLGECKYGELGLTPPMQGRQAATEQDEARWLQRLAEFEAERVGLG